MSKFVAGQGELRLVLAGELIALASSLVLLRLSASLFEGVSAHDPRIMILAVATLALVSRLAFDIRARRRAKVDPGRAAIAIGLPELQRH